MMAVITSFQGSIALFYELTQSLHRHSCHEESVKSSLLESLKRISSVVFLMNISV